MTDVPSLLAALAPVSDIDFAEFGETEVTRLPRIQKLTASFLARNWVTIPHVTHHDEVDVTELEERRKAWNTQNPQSKLTPVTIVLKALVPVLQQFPQFNASLTADGNSLVLKKYIHIGVAVDTPSGLLVPVLRNVPDKSLAELTGELAAVAEKARTKGLSLPEMSGSSFTVTSLGHIGGTAFTPIINAPDLAILGMTALQIRPAPGPDGGVIWRKMLPVSLSYDHRVINGADAARFVRALGQALADPNLIGQA
ncbi:MAG TPA: 2-oxo acid dehydrogenase subunit E2 [Pedomonas sp.]|uniref:2-oxo acid dehydrogenase subunit E2 n=1 Tax=Pedomonas sp. TaxID=2976421 RepID=UPI002F42DF12